MSGLLGRVTGISPEATVKYPFIVKLCKPKALLEDSVLSVRRLTSSSSGLEISLLV